MQQKQISKTLLQRTHQHQIESGIKNDEFQQDIVEILGGIDEILTHLFESNIIFTQKQMNDIYQIISEPQTNNSDGN